MGGLFHVQETGIKAVYDWYRQGLLKVDRKYQRKLVWELEDKRALVDTILNGYPLPLIMLVGNDSNKASKTVMDGLQRLEAIFAFIENKYSIDYKGIKGYFNLDCLSGCWDKLDIYAGLCQKDPVLDRDLCNEFLSYYLPTMFISEEMNIEEAFKRLNSTGHKLSSQSLRQAGVTNNFSRLVHEIATTIRGDYTVRDVVDFADMEKISLSGKGLSYGLKIKDIYWIRQDIMNTAQLRRSKDEEIIAHIINYIINGCEVRMRTSVLDALYDPDSDISKHNEEKLSNNEKYGGYCEFIKRIHSDLSQALECSGQSFACLLCKDPKQYNKDLLFIIVFLTLVELYREKYVIDDYTQFSIVLKDLAVKEMPELLSNRDYLLTIDKRQHFIERLKPIFRDHMHYQEFNPEWNAEVVALLKQAQLESSYFDFKIGFHDFGTGNSNLAKVIDKCICTLAAMCNSNPGKTCYIIIGVADSKQQAIAFEKHYNIHPIHVNDVYLTGVNAEAVKYYGGIDGLTKRISAEFRNMQKYGTFAESVAMSSRPVRYNDRTLITFSYCAKEKPIMLDGTVYTRNLNSNHMLAVTDTEDLMTLATEFCKKLTES